MAAIAQNPPSTLYLAQARASHNMKDCMALYDKWAATYNDEVGHEAQDYVAPAIVAQLTLKASTDLSRQVILDAGCGTGLVGQALASLGARTIDGIDLSVPMLKVAEKTGVYHKLAKADMTKHLDQEDETYDSITCAGTFTAGHVGPQPALRELVRITKKGGNIIATVLEEIWIGGGFKSEVEHLVAEGAVTLVADELLDYVKGHGDKAVFVVLKKHH